MVVKWLNYIAAVKATAVFYSASCYWQMLAKLTQILAKLTGMKWRKEA